MFYKTYSILLIFICEYFFEDVIGNILLINPQEVKLDNVKRKLGIYTKALWITEEYFNSPSDFIDGIFYDINTERLMKKYCLEPSKKYLLCGPLILDFENNEQIFAELYVNFNNIIDANIKNKDIIYIKITFEKDNVILNYKGKDNYFEYNVEDMNKKIESFMSKINDFLQIKIIKIQTSMLYNNTSLINDTVYDEQTRNRLENLVNSSLWKYVEEELVQSYFPRLPDTTIYDFILNSTMYRSDIEFTLKKAKKIMCNRTYKYAILLMVYAYEALRIDHCTTPYWDQLIYNLNKLSSTLLKLNGDVILEQELHKIHEVNNVFDIMCVFKGLVNHYTNIFLRPQQIENNNYKNNYKWENIKDEDILSQNLLDRILKGLPNPRKYNFERIPVNVCGIERKFQQIFKLIKAEFITIHVIDIDI